MFFLALPCFCEKPISPSQIRFLLFGPFMHKVAIIDANQGLKDQKDERSGDSSEDMQEQSLS